MRITVHIPDNLAESLKMAALNEGLRTSAMTARRMYSLIGPTAISEDAMESLDRERADDRA